MVAAVLAHRTVEERGEGHLINTVYLDHGAHRMRSGGAWPVIVVLVVQVILVSRIFSKKKILFAEYCVLNNTFLPLPCFFFVKVPHEVTKFTRRRLVRQPTRRAKGCRRRLQLADEAW